MSVNESESNYGNERLNLVAMETEWKFLKVLMERMFCCQAEFNGSNPAFGRANGILMDRWYWIKTVDWNNL